MATPLRSADALVNKILADPDLLKKVKKDPQTELPAAAKELLETLPLPIQVGDTWVYRFLVIGLVAVGLASIIGAIVLASNKAEIPEILATLGGAAVGGLAGLLAPSPIKQ